MVSNPRNRYLLVAPNKTRHNAPVGHVFIWRMVRQASVQALGVACNPNTLRKTAAVMFADRAGAGILRWMGWDDGTISRLYWPDEGRVWPWIVYGQATVPTVPFSLEGLPLSKSYEGRFNPGYIEKQDEEIILPYIQWDLAELPAPALQLVPASQVAQKFGRTRALSAIYNHDRIAVLRPVPKILTSTEVFVRNQWLSESLKAYYDCRCQICGMDFEPMYGVPVADTHHIQYLSEGGPDVSGNIVVVCRTITACFTQRMPASTVSISRMSIQTACASR